MAGPPIRQAKQSLLRALAQLEPGDSFNIVAYNNRAWSLFDEPQRAADFNLTLARSFVEGLEADGGTEMLPALALALQQPAVTNADVLPQVLFMTDGAVSNESGLLNYIDQHLGERRLFTIGIGSAPNSYFMRKAAQTGRGSYEYVANSEELPLYMDRLLARIRQAALSDISVEWPQGISPEYYPQRLPDLYPGESLLMSVRVDGSEAMPGQIRLNARHQGRVWHASAEIPDQTGAVPPGALATVWARAKIETLTDALNALGGASDAVEKQALLQQQILDTALEYQLASQFTSFVAVDSQRVQENKTRKQAAHYLAQTGNGATQSLLWGSVLLLMFIVIYRCIQREA
jgi:Ca-activated chloride channel family protein